MDIFTLTDAKRIHQEAKEILEIETQQRWEESGLFLGYDKDPTEFHDRLAAWSVEGVSLQDFLVKKSILTRSDQIEYESSIALRQFVNKLSKIIQLWEEGKLDNKLNENPSENYEKVAKTKKDPSMKEPKIVQPNKVFVVHGRNQKAKNAMFIFLRSIGLDPLEWNEAVTLTGNAAPSISEILKVAFANVQAVVVLFTGDDVAKLQEELTNAHDSSFEKNLTPQPRPNVIFEAGMAFALHPKRTIIVELGNLRPFSDISGLHIIKFNDSPKERQGIADRLKTAGCSVKLNGTDWQTAGEFPSPLFSSIQLSSSQKEKFKYDGVRYWKLDLNEKIIKEEGAYCAVCYDERSKEIRLQQCENGYYNCGVCKKDYGKWKETPSSVQLKLPQRRGRK